MAETLQWLMALSLAVFMVGNLLAMGLQLEFRGALVALANVRFVALSLLWCFAVCPALAWLLTELIPLARPYAVGLLLLGMTPCAPFLPVVADKARGDRAHVAAFMLLAFVGTVIFMPLAVPWLVAGFGAEAWTIAKPLVLFLVVPLAVGLAIQRASAILAAKLHSIVKKATAIDTVLMLGLCAFIYRRDFASAVGSFATVTQIVYLSLVTSASYVLGFGLTRDQRSVLALGVCTRNIGAAVAPLIAVAGVDRRSIAMVVLAVPLTLIMSFLVARRLAGGVPARDMTNLQRIR